MTFDTVLMVDWSGGNDRGPAPVQDAIWLCVARGGRSEEPRYMHSLYTTCFVDAGVS